MNRYDIFYNKVIDNEVLVKNLKNLEGGKWDFLSFNEKVKTFKIIMDEICMFYEELGLPNFDFIFMDDNFSGEDNEKGTFINVKLLVEGNHFEILATCLHELRHFYQDRAVELYEKKGIVHEMFDKEELLSFKENIQRSALYTSNNYLELVDGINSYDYYLQPVEYDAESFSYEFMRRLAKNFLKDKYDVMNCRCANSWFSSVVDLKKGNKNNIIEFNKIYYYNYLDRIRENKVQFREEKRIEDNLNKWKDRIDLLSDSKLFMLLNCCFLEKYSDSEIVSLLNAYLKNNDCDEVIEYLDNGYYLDGLLLDFKGKTIYEIIEPVFEHLADFKIRQIVTQDLENLKFGFEKEIKINLSRECNKIKEENNPLLYRIQPYMLYKNGFIKNEYVRLISSIDCMYETYNNYFEEFSYYLKKYDNSSLIKKVEILTSKKFADLYNEVFMKMKDNLIEKGKASR